MWGWRFMGLCWRICGTNWFHVVVSFIFPKWVSGQGAWKRKIKWSESGHVLDSVIPLLIDSGGNGGESQWGQSMCQSSMTIEDWERGSIIVTLWLGSPELAAYVVGNWMNWLIWVVDWEEGWRPVSILNWEDWMGGIEDGGKWSRRVI